MRRGHEPGRTQLRKAHAATCGGQPQGNRRGPSRGLGKVRTVFAFRVLHGNVIHIRKGRADGHLAHEGYGTTLSERGRNRGVADDGHTKATATQHAVSTYLGMALL
jgi:hypothetical protein